MLTATGAMPTLPARLPRPLPPGGHIRLVAPCSPFDPGLVEAGRRTLLERGFSVSPAPALDHADRYLAHDDVTRAALLVDALTAPGVDAVLAARGGYGATRLLPLLERSLPALRAAEPRWLLGFSDITALHAFLAQRLGWVSAHGPVCTSLGKEPPETVDHLLALLGNRGAARTLAGRTLAGHGRVEGPLVGGNLAVLAALCGTPYLPAVDGRILLLEDVTEKPYRLDRLLTQLLQCTGGLHGVRGIALGHFTECDEPDKGQFAADTLRERLAGLGVPVVAELPVGHQAPNYALPHHGTVVLDADAGTLVVPPVATG